MFDRWREPGLEDALVPRDGEWTEVSGAEILALHHEFDGIPEGFFLVPLNLHQATVATSVTRCPPLSRLTLY